MNQRWIIDDVEIETKLHEYGNARGHTSLPRALIIDSHDANIKALFKKEWPKMQECVVSLPDLDPKLEAKIEPFKTITDYDTLIQYTFDVPVGHNVIETKLNRIALELWVQPFPRVHSHVLST